MQPHASARGLVLPAGRTGPLFGDRRFARSTTVTRSRYRPPRRAVQLLFGRLPWFAPRFLRDFFLLVRFDMRRLLLFASTAQLTTVARTAQPPVSPAPSEPGTRSNESNWAGFHTAAANTAVAAGDHGDTATGGCHAAPPPRGRVPGGTTTSRLGQWRLPRASRPAPRSPRRTSRTGHPRSACRWPRGQLAVDRLNGRRPRSGRTTAGPGASATDGGAVHAHILKAQVLRDTDDVRRVGDVGEVAVPGRSRSGWPRPS
jgi:hypothetical protein